ncbi:pentapeptide repeat-containing protein [Fluviicola sp.]|uniref:pentapeptide repeat-containing protein n=1 Tax=Fluviicola sp. TaxID=1917219 RepID=UPI0031DC322B
MFNSKIIGERITEARKKTAVSQAGLAELLFISPQAVGKWERGESMPDILTLNRLAEILQVDLNYFSENFPSVAREDQTPVVPEAVPSTPSKKKPLSWDMSKGSWADADFSGLKNLHEKFSSSHLKNCKFIGSDLSGLQLSDNYVLGCNFSGSDLSNSQLKGSHLTKNAFRECLLKATEFTGSHLSGCDFSGADFSEAVFKSGGFEKNTLENALWKHVSFREMYLADLVFEGIVEDCYFENCAFKRITFKDAVLTNTFFKNKSLKHIRFVDCKADRITYEFLKNGKADLSGLELIDS